jgi:acyl-CoA synthetase (AMP-forming)/AMP-acid ligase II
MPDDSPTLCALLRFRAQEAPDQHAYTFLDDGRKEGERLTYGELDRHARRIAAWLQASVPKGGRALLLFPAGLDVLKAFFGCLYAGVIAIPAPPPESSRIKRTLPRLQAVAQDANVSVVISTSETLEIVAAWARDVPELQTMKYLNIEDIAADWTDKWHDPEATPDDLAYLQYTSGSTTGPKGVMLSNRNVVHHCGYLQACCEYKPDSISVTWLPYFHDYGLVEGLLVPLYNGTPCYVMSPFAFLKHPINWLAAITRFRATHTQAPNFAYDQCVRRIKPEQRAQLDLSSLQSAGNGAEPINPEVLDRFEEMFAPCGFRWQSFCPAYGLAEATLMISCCSPSIPPRIGSFDAEALTRRRVIPASETETDSGLVRKVTSCGPLVGETIVVLANPDTLTRCAPDEIGEIWVSDPGVALGYWQREVETNTTFRAHLADTGAGPFLRTGDLGFIQDGELFITSRIKDLIIIAGTNHHPQDIEWTVERCHSGVRPNCVAAFSILVAGEERLVIAPEIERGVIDATTNTDEIIAAVRRAVTSGHELQVYGVLLLARGSLPKTASGKIQRSACWAMFQEGGPQVLASWFADANRQAIPATTTKISHSAGERIG